jgi:hypothetical protein
MSNIAKYSCTALAGTNKVGKLRADENGYREMVLGAYDFDNSAGAVYPFESAQSLFKSSSSLMRRIANGQCRGEYGHPKPLPGMTNQQYLERILRIEESAICVHFKEVWIDKDNVKDERGKPVIAVVGKVKPCGPNGPALEEQLNNTEENVAFSVRSLTNDRMVAGKLHKHMKVLVCWDYVNEPGISVANKYQAPALEGISDDIEIVPSMLDVAERHQQRAGVSMENAVSSTMVRSELGWSKVQNLSTASQNW